MKKRESEKLKESSLQSVLDLRERDEELSQKMEKLKTPEGVEEEIRTKFGVAKENENVVIIVNEDSNAKASTTKTSLWQKIKNIFK
jgi:hypothetical protein